MHNLSRQRNMYIVPICHGHTIDHRLYKTKKIPKKEKVEELIDFSTKFVNISRF
jgi:hypothetical protein